MHKFIGKKTILRSDIAHIERFHGSLIGGIRLFGFGGYKNRTGWYWHKGIGRYYSYVTDTTQMILVTQTNGKKIMLSCNEADEVVEEFEKE